jgi:hypothetical protein
MQRQVPRIGEWNTDVKWIAESDFALFDNTTGKMGLHDIGVGLVLTKN